MPKYDYRCSAGHQYEKREGFDAPAVQSCELCGTEARRVLTPPAIVFKGSGWYVTDSRSSSSSVSSSNGSGSPSEDAPAKSEPAKGEPTTATESSSSTAAAAD